MPLGLNITISYDVPKWILFLAVIWMKLVILIFGTLGSGFVDDHLLHHRFI